MTPPETTTSAAPPPGLGARMAISSIRFYQYCLSPLAGPCCRHLPTCADYAAEAVRRHGLLRGCWLAARRLGRCHPWGTSGYDPVPD